MTLRDHSEDSLRLSREPWIIARLALCKPISLGGVDEDVFVQRHNVCRAQFAIRIGLVWGVMGIEAQQEQVIVFDELVDVVLKSPQIVVAVRQLHPVGL